MLPELRGQIPPGQEGAGITAAGAFTTRKCHRYGGLRGPSWATVPLRTIAARGAAALGPSLEPVAFVPSLPPRRNARFGKPESPGAFGMVLGPVADHASPRNEALRASRRLGRTIWRRW